MNLLSISNRFLLIAFMLLMSQSCKRGLDTGIVPTNNYDFSVAEKLIQDNLAKYEGNAVVMVSQNGKLIYNKNFGPNLSENSIRAVASCSKWLSGAVIMALVDEGKLSLNDSLGKYLPLFTKYKKGKITIRQLFSHTSGFPAESPQDFERRKDLTLAQAVDSMAVKTNLINSAGTKFYYGNVGMHIAGRVVEVVSGKSFQTLFNEKIGTPCQMSVYYSLGNINNPLIAGGAACTPRDYLNFLEMVVNKGTFNGKRVLSEKSIDEMELDQTNVADIAYTPYPTNLFSVYQNRPVRYGIGLWRDVVNSANGEAIEVSSPGLFGTHPWRNRNQKVAGIIFTMSDFTTVQETNLRVREAFRKAIN